MMGEPVAIALLASQLLRLLQSAVPLHGPLTTQTSRGSMHRRNHRAHPSVPNIGCALSFLFFVY